MQSAWRGGGHDDSVRRFQHAVYVTLLGRALGQEDTAATCDQQRSGRRQNLRVGTMLQATVQTFAQRRDVVDECGTAVNR
jgi:hypothetical protein